jgi:hypothetical protein
MRVSRRDLLEFSAVAFGTGAVACPGVATAEPELLGMYLVTRSRHANLLLEVPPDRHGVIPVRYVEALARLERNIAKLGLSIPAEG